MSDMWRRYRRSRPAVIALAVLATYALAALLASAIAPYDPLAISAIGISPPGPDHLMGTDQLGRDIFSRVLFGARLSLRVAGISVLIALTAGGLLGLVAGYFGGALDALLSRLTDMMFALPDILLALVIMSILGQGLTNISIAVGLVYIPIFTRICRAATLSVKERPFVEAGRALGLSHARLLLRHVLPNILTPLIVQASLSFAFALLSEAALSFLGLSGETDAPLWGLMLRRGKDVMHLGWWIAVFPGLAVTLAVLSLNIVGDGLRDALDPRLRQQV